MKLSTNKTIEWLFEKFPFEGEYLDISEKNIKVKSRNIETGNDEMKRILALVKKQDAEEYVINHINGQLRCSAQHSVFDESNHSYITVDQLNPIKHIINVNGIASSEFTVIKTGEIIPIVDIEVEDNHNYYANGVLSKNTTTGGMALRYACSVRVELTRSKKIEANEKAIIGYETKAKIVKNKVGPPGGECTFDIYFNRGVSDDEQTLKFLKKNNLIDEITSQRSALQLADGSKIEFKNKEFDAVFGQHADYIKGLVKASLVVDLTNPELSTTRVEVSDFITNGGEKIDPETGEILTSRKKKEVLVDID